MYETYVVTWSPEKLELHIVANEGVWQSSDHPVKSMSLHRPTRLPRLINPAAGGKLADGLVKLFEDVDISLPLWILIPREWTYPFTMPNPNLGSDELKRAHLLWETRQRLHGDPADFIALLPKDFSTPSYSVYPVRKEVFNTFHQVTKSAELEIAGIGVEPGESELYSFENPLDLREAEPIDETEYVEGKNSAKVPSWIPLTLGVGVLIAAAVAYWYINFIMSGALQPDAAGKKEIPTIAAAAPDTAAMTASPRAGAAAVQPPAAGGVLTPPSTAVAAGGGSPLKAVAGMLPAGARIELAVLTAHDFRVEIVGLKAPDEMLNRLRASPQMQSVSNVGGYDLAPGKAVVFRIENPGWKGGSGALSNVQWKQKAASAGMKAKGRSASGSYEAALALFDGIWTDPSGASKAYLARDKGGWIVTVQ